MVSLTERREGGGRGSGIDGWKEGGRLGGGAQTTVHLI